MTNAIDAVLNVSGTPSDTQNDTYAQYGKASIIPHNHPFYDYEVDLTTPFPRYNYTTSYGPPE